MPIRITQADSFTDRPFAGNPAAVCILPEAAEPAWMLNVAREMNLAETAFLVPQRAGYDLRGLTPELTAVSRVDARGVIVTSRSNGKSGHDFVSRFFAPQSGVPEDPVTGSAHCALAPYWSAKLGKTELVAYQASPRGGELRLRLVGDRVKIGGQAVTVVRPELTTDSLGA